MNGAPAVNPLLQLAPFALILVVFYFLLIRPQQRKARETEEMLAALRAGDEIVTTGGIHGKIARIQDKVLHVEIAPKIQIRIDRSAVSRLAGAPRPAPGKGAEEKPA